MTEIREIASGLEFPEGPIALGDGSILVVEIKRGTLARVSPGGAGEVVAEARCRREVAAGRGAGRWGPMPDRGPEASKRMSFPILFKDTAICFSAPCDSTMAS